ncbi:MAG: T9SS type A sorting domain-containing protein, partial [Bacteroidota bacterium]
SNLTNEEKKIVSLDQFYIYFDRLKDFISARKILNELENNYKDDDIIVAKYLLEQAEEADIELSSNAVPNIYKTKVEIAKREKEKSSEKEDVELDECYPNPFNPATTLSYNIPREGFVSIKIFNTLGQQIATLVEEYKSKGNYRVTWNASGLPSGIYYSRLSCGAMSDIKKLILTK